MSVPGGGQAPNVYVPGIPYPVPADMTPEDVSKMRAYFAQQADAEASRFNTGTALTQQGYANQSSIAAANNAARIKEAAMQIKADRYKFDQQFGLDTQKFGETQREFNTNTGLDVLKTGASLRGPLDVFQGQAYARGVQGAGLAPYLQSLLGGGTPLASGGTATQGNPTPLTVGTLANDLSGGQGVGSLSGGTAGVGASGQGAATGAAVDQFGRPSLTGSYAQNLGAINTVAQGGLGNLGQGALERLTPGELDTFKSGLGYLGRSADDELAAYKRSRVGQGSVGGA